MNNCKRLSVKRSCISILQTGYVGYNEETLEYFFRPDRGSGGYVPYETEEQARRFTGCAKIVKVGVNLTVSP